jgi:transposase-like protein
MTTQEIFAGFKKLYDADGLASLISKVTNDTALLAALLHQLLRHPHIVQI